MQKKNKVYILAYCVAIVCLRQFREETYFMDDMKVQRRLLLQCCRSEHTRYQSNQKHQPLTVTTVSCHDIDYISRLEIFFHVKITEDFIPISFSEALLALIGVLFNWTQKRATPSKGSGPPTVDSSPLCWPITVTSKTQIVAVSFIIN